MRTSTAICSYKQETPNEHYNTIVIGSGIGGLAAAAVLAQEGQRVLVLEKHYSAGGFTHVFKRRDYEWDVGIHYLGEFHRSHSEVAGWFRYITGNKIRWETMGEVYDRIFFGNDRYEFRTGKAQFIEGLAEKFPGAADRQAIARYVDTVYAAQKAGRTYFADKILPAFLSNTIGYLMRRPMMRYASQTTWDVLRSITQNERLIGVLAAQYGDYGLPPRKSSFVIHAMVAKHYMNGACFPIGGCSQIAVAAADVIAKTGGRVMTNAEVVQIMTHNNKAIGVKMADGRVITADYIVSNAGILNTFGQLLPENTRTAIGADQYLTKVEPSASHIGLYLGFKHTAQELSLEKPNYWVFPENSYDHDQNIARFSANPKTAPLPLTFISFPSAKDPDWCNRYPGRATIDIISLADPKWFEPWRNQQWHKRGHDYNALKEEFSQKMMAILYEKIPQTRGKVDYYELSTPLSTAHFTGYSSGEIYGIAHTPERFARRFLRPQTPIKNLYLCGQDIISCGVAGGLTGGILAAIALLKKPWLLNKIRKAAT